MTQTPTTPEVKPSTKTKPQNKPLPPYHVVLLDDNDHSVEYVMVMLRELCGHPHEAGYKLAMQVDRQGRAIVLTTHKERAELKCEQIHAYGPDHAVATCRGSMSALIVPADDE